MNTKTFATHTGFSRTRNSGLHLPSFLSHAIQSYNRWTSQRKAARQLMAMDDHMLQDIGVYRCDIKNVVRR